MQSSKNGLILYHYNRPQQGREHFYAIGKLENGQSFGIIDQHYAAHFYIDAADSQIAQEYMHEARVQSGELRDMHGNNVLSIISDTDAQRRRLSAQLQKAGIATYEADLHFNRAWLIDHAVRGPIQISGEWKSGSSVDWIIYNPQISNIHCEISLSLLALDIETDFNGIETGNEKVTAISLIGHDLTRQRKIRQVLIVDPQQQLSNTEYRQCFKSETELLLAFLQQVREFDPDIISGWNVIDFDFKTLCQRFEKLKILFKLGRSQDRCSYREGKRWGSSKMNIPGRQVLDAMHLMRHTLRRFEDYKLDTIAEVVLGRKKLLQINETKTVNEQIQDAYLHNKELFADYCLEDAQLVLDILEVEDLIQLTINRANLTGLPLDRAWGSVEAFEFLYLSELHKRQIVVRSVDEEERDPDHAPGGYVFSPKVGLYDHIFVLDFKSLYPSIIRTFNIDPLAYARAESGTAIDLISAPNGARFIRERGILPGLLDVFFEKRAEAKLQNNELASYTYKIVMNSFYGVLGSGGCRFAKPQLAGAITHFGHLLLNWCRDLLEENGYAVLYGDTDSVFVDAHLDLSIKPATARQIGADICNLVNTALTDYVRKNYGLESMLELEFDKHYRKLLLPPSRDDDEIGRAKGYAGLLINDDTESVDIVGLEAVRRDWTDLAQQFQRQLFALLFKETDAATIEHFIRHQVIAIYAGKHDADLVYRRALRKPVAEYTKTTPPHVKAARLLDHPQGLIHYVMTIHGPQPLGAVSSALDYDHYMSKQITPIVNAVAQFCGINVQRALSGEQSFL